MSFTYPAEKQSKFLQLCAETEDLLDRVKFLTQKTLPLKENEVKTHN
jgi:hypothetical protein